MEQRSPLLAGLRRLFNLLVEGFATLNHRPWILLVPIGLDLFFWLGPQILPLHLAEGLAASWQQAAQQAPAALQADPDLIARGVTALTEWGNGTNMAHLMTVSLIPTLVPRLSAPALPGYMPASWAPAVGWILGPLPLAAVAIGVLLWSLYLTPIADLVRGNREDGWTMLRRAGRNWLHVVGLLGLLLILGLLFTILLGFLISIVSLFGTALASALVYLGIAFVLGALFYLYFAPQAILLSGIGPRRAILYSVFLVRANIWLSLGFVLLISMVRIGTVLLWEQLALWPLGVLAAIIGNAYIVSGLATASILFYRDRMAALTKEAEA